jgi:hypothetical protein
MSGKSKLFDGKPWMPIPLAVIESDAWRSLGINAHRLVSFLMREQMRHGGKENGKLKAPRTQLGMFGIGRSEISKAITQAEEFGLVECQRNGLRTASTYALTWLPLHDGTPATDGWRFYRNPELEPLTAPKSKNLGRKVDPGLGRKVDPDDQNLGRKVDPDDPKSLGRKVDHLLRSSFRDRGDITDVSGAGAGRSNGRGGAR